MKWFLKNRVCKQFIACLLILTLLFSSMPLSALAADPPLPAGGSGGGSTELSLEEQYDANAARLAELDASFTSQLADLKALQNEGKLPGLSVAGLNLGTYEMMDAFVNGLDLLLLKIGGISKLNTALFQEYTKSVYVGQVSLIYPAYADVTFPQGILNAVTIADKNLPGQSLETLVAAQEYNLYVAEAVSAMLTIVTGIADSKSLDSLDLVDALTIFSAFNEAEMDGLLNAFKNSDLAQEQITVSLTGTSSKGTTTKNVTLKTSDLISGALSDYATGYNYIPQIRDSIFGSLGIDSGDLSSILALINEVLSGDIYNKYLEIDFSNANLGADTALAYLAEDLGRIKAVIETANNMSSAIAKLLGLDETSGDLIQLVSQLLGGENGDGLVNALAQFVEQLVVDSVPTLANINLAEIINSLLGGVSITSTQQLLDLLDQCIAAINQTRAELADIQLKYALQLAKDIISGQVVDKYTALSYDKLTDFGQLLKYVRDDVHGSLAILQSLELLNNSLKPLLNGASLSDLVLDYLQKTLPGILDGFLEDLYPGAAGSELGQILAQLLEPLKGASLSTTIDYLKGILDVLDYLVDIYDQIEVLFEYDENGYIKDLNLDEVLKALGTSQAEVKAIIEQYLKAAHEAVQEFLAELRQAGELSKEELQAALDELHDKLADICGEFEKALDFLREVKAAIDWAIEHYENIKDYLQDQDLADLLKDILKQYQPQIQALIDNILNNHNLPSLDELKNIAGKICNDLKALIERLEQAKNKLEEIRKWAEENITDENLKKLVEAALECAQDQLTEAVKDFLAQPNVQKLLERAQDIYDSLKAFLLYVQQPFAIIATPATEDGVHYTLTTNYDSLIQALEKLFSKLGIEHGFSLNAAVDSENAPVDGFALDGNKLTSAGLAAGDYRLKVSYRFTFQLPSKPGHQHEIILTPATAWLDVTIEGEEPGPEPLLTGIEAAAAQTSYEVGQTMNAANLTVYAFYDNVKADTPLDPADYTVEPALPYAFTTAGPLDFTITYQGQQTTVTITVSEAVDPTPVREQTGLLVNTNDMQVAYALAEDPDDPGNYLDALLDTAGLEVYAVFNDGTWELLDPAAYSVSPGHGDTLGNQAGPVSISVSDGAFDASFDVTLYIEPQEPLDPQIVDFTVNATAMQRAYEQGDLLDTNGLLTYLVYDNGNLEATSDYSTDPAAGTALDTLGALWLEVHYTGTETVAHNSHQVLLQVSAPEQPEVTLSSISISKQPTTTRYSQNGTLNLAGLEVTAHYSDGSSQVLTTGAYTTSPAEGATLSSTGTVTVTVSHQDKTATFSVSVTAGSGGPGGSSGGGGGSNPPATQQEAQVEEPSTPLAGGLELKSYETENAELLPYYLDAAGQKIFVAFSFHKDGNLYYLANPLYSYQFTANPKTFNDIASHWGKDDILFNAMREIFVGTGNGNFSPNAQLTRGMVVTILGRMAGINPAGYSSSQFTDVAADAWYMPYVAWAAENKIATAAEANLFQPTAPISREETALMLANFIKYMQLDLPQQEATPFADLDQCGSEQTKDAITYLQTRGLIIGKSESQYDPQGTLTRAENTAMLHRLIEATLESLIELAHPEVAVEE